MNTFEVALRTGTLPDKIEELVPMMFAGQAAVKFMSAKLKLVSDKNLNDPMGILDEQRKRTVEDGQCMGEMLLKVMGKIGEMSEGISQGRGELIHVKGKAGGSGSKPSTSPAKHEKLGLKDRKQLKQAQFIKNHPDLVEKTIRECKKNEDIPNITTVLNKHKHARALEKEKQRHEKAINEGRTQKTTLQMTIEQIQYMNALELFLMKVPKEPPRDWNKDSFDKVCELWDTIFEYGKLFKSINNKQIGV